jgi:WD40 repeat protein
MKISKAHSILARDLDFNPNKQYQLATGGDDCKTKIWDIRSPKNHILEIVRHTHWVWNVNYNRFHDQLLLTSGSDCNVNLESIVSVSSAKTKLSNSQDESGDELSKTEDGLVKHYDQHEDSVYASAWSYHNPWIFASISGDGRVVINHVPSSHKYKIMI